MANPTSPGDAESAAFSAGAPTIVLANGMIESVAATLAADHDVRVDRAKEILEKLRS